MRPRLSGANSHGLTEFGNEYLAVTNLPRSCRFDDGFNHPIDLVVIDRQFQFYLGEEIHDVFRPSIQLSVTLLATEALDLCHGNALHANFRQCRAQAFLWD